MADKRCQNGHVIDESWDICPFCPAPPKNQQVQVVVPRPPGKEPAAAPHRRQAPLAPPLKGDSPAPVISAPNRTTVLAQPESGARVRRYVVGWLVGLNKDIRGESWPIRIGKNVLGRERGSDIVISDDLVSAHHADIVFRPEEKRYILMDANSTNGTFVNGNEISNRHDLAANEVVGIGGHRFLFVPLCHEGFYWEDEGLLK